MDDDFKLDPQGIVIDSSVNEVKPIKIETPKIIDPRFGGIPGTPPEGPLGKKWTIDNDEDNDAQQRGAGQFASGVVRASDTPFYQLPTVSAKRLYEETLGVTKYSALRSAVGLTDGQSFTEFYRQNGGFVPAGFELDAKLLLEEERIKELESRYLANEFGYAKFLFEAYGRNIAKAQGEDFKSSLYWYQRRRNGQFDNPLNNPTYLSSLLDQAEKFYKAEVWSRESSSRRIDAELLELASSGVRLEPEKVRDLFPEIFAALDEFYDNDLKIVQMYRAGLLKDFNPIIDVNGDGKPEFYYHTDGMLYRVEDDGKAKPNEARAFYNADGSLDRIVTPYTVEGLSDFSSGLMGMVKTVTEVIVGGGAAIVDTIKGLATGDWTYQTVQDFYLNFNDWANTDANWLFGNGVYTTANGFLNADGSFDVDGVLRGAAGAAGIVSAIVATAGLGKIASGIKLAAVPAKATTGVKLATLGKNIGMGAVKYTLSAASIATGYSNGTPLLPQIAKTAQGATIQGLVALALRDYSSSIAQLQLNKKRLGLTDADIASRAAITASINFGISFALRSTMNKGALTRHAEWVKVTFGKANAAGELVLNGGISSAFVNIINKFATSLPKTYAAFNSGIDILENIWTMSTLSNLIDTGEVNALPLERMGKAIMNPQTAFMQLYIFTNTFGGGFGKTNEGLKTGQILGAIDDVKKIYDNGIVRLRSKITEANKKGDVNGAKYFTEQLQKFIDQATYKHDETTGSLIKDSNGNPVRETQELLGITRALAWGMNEFKSSKGTGSSFIDKEIKQAFDQGRVKNVLAQYEFASDYYKALYNARDAVFDDLFIKGSFENGEVEKITQGKFLKKQNAIFNKLNEIVNGTLKNDNNIFRLMTDILVNKQVASEVARFATSAEFEQKLSLIKRISGNIKGLPSLSTGKDKTKGFGGPFDPEDKVNYLGEQTIEALKALAVKTGFSSDEDFVTWAGDGFFFVIPGKGSTDAGEIKLYQDFVKLFGAIAKVSETETTLGQTPESLIFKLNENTFFMPNRGSSFQVENAAQFSYLAKSLYALKYSDAATTKTKALEAIVGILNGNPYEFIPGKTDPTTMKINNDTLTDVLGKLLAENYISETDVLEYFSSPNGKQLISGPKTSMPDKIRSIAEVFELTEKASTIKDILTVKDSNIKKQYQKELKTIVASLAGLTPEQRDLFLRYTGFSKPELNRLTLQYYNSDFTLSQKKFETLLKGIQTGTLSADPKTRKLQEKILNKFVNLFVDPDLVDNKVREQRVQEIQKSVVKLAKDNVELSNAYKTLFSSGLTIFDITPEKLNNLFLSAAKDPADTSTKTFLSTESRTKILNTVAEQREKLFFKNMGYDDGYFKDAPLDVNNKIVTDIRNVIFKYYESLKDQNTKSFNENLNGIEDFEKLFGIDLSFYKDKKIDSYGSDRIIFTSVVSRIKKEISDIFGSFNLIKSNGLKPEDLKLDNPDVKNIVLRMVQLRTIVSPLIKELSSNQEFIFGESFDVILKNSMDEFNRLNFETNALTPEQYEVEFKKMLPFFITNVLNNKMTGKPNAVDPTKMFYMFTEENKVSVYQAALKQMGIDIRKPRKPFTLEDYQLTKNPNVIKQIHSVVFRNDNTMLDYSFEYSPLTTKLVQSINSHYKLYNENTQYVKGNNKLYINIHELVGRTTYTILETLHSKDNVQALNMERETETLAILRQRFGDEANDAGYQMRGEYQAKLNLLREYPSGVIVIDLGDQGLDRSNPGLSQILSRFNWSENDLKSNIQTIPGIYFKGNTLDAAVDIDLKTQNNKNQLINDLKERAEEQRDNIRQKNQKNNITDYLLAMSEIVNGFVFINNDTVLFGKDLKEIPLTDIDPNALKFSQNITSVSAFERELKQGITASSTIKLMQFAYEGFGAYSSKNGELSDAYFIISLIRKLGEYAENGSDKVPFTKRLTQKEFMFFDEAYKKNPLYKITPVAGSNEVADGVEFITYRFDIEPNFKNNALTYLKQNSKGYIPIIIFPGNFDNKQTIYSGNMPFTRPSGLEQQGSTPLSYASVQMESRFDFNFYNQFFNSKDTSNQYLPRSLNFKEVDSSDEAIILSAIKNQTVKTILSKSFAEKYKDNIYYQMIKANVLAATKVNEYASNNLNQLFRTLQIDESTGEVNQQRAQNLLNVLGDVNVRRIIGDGLNLKLDYKKIAENVNTYLRNPQAPTTENYGKQFYDSRKTQNKEDGILTAYDIESLTPVNKFNSSFQVSESDIELFKKTIDSTTLPFSYGESNVFEENVFDTIASLIGMSGEDTNTGFKMFVSSLEKINQKTFDQLIEILEDNGVDQNTIDLITSKYDLIKSMSSIQYDSNVIENKLEIENISAPTIKQGDDFLFRNGDRLNNAAFKDAVRNARNMAYNQGLSKQRAKIAELSYADGELGDVVKRFGEFISNKVVANNMGSLLIDNLQIQSEMGRFLYNITGLSEILMDQFKTTEEGAIDLAMEMYSQSNGVDYSKVWSRFLVYDTKENKVIKLIPTIGKGKEALNVLFRDIWDFMSNKEDLDSERFKVIVLEKNMMHDVDVVNGGKIKYLDLNEATRDSLIEIAYKNAWYQNKQGSNAKLTPEAAQEAMKNVYGRALTDIDMYQTAVERFSGLFDDEVLGTKFARALFLNTFSRVHKGRTANEQAVFNRLALETEQTEISRERLNYYEQTVNDRLKYLVSYEDLPAGIKKTLDRLKGNFLRDTNNKTFIEAFGGVDELDKLSNLISNGNFKEAKEVFDAKFMIYNKRLRVISLTPEYKKDLFKKFLAYHVLSKRDGATLNYLFGKESMSDFINPKFEDQRLNFKTNDGSQFSPEDIYKNGFNVLDMEMFFDRKSGLKNVFQFTFKTFEGVKNIKDFVNKKEELRTKGVPQTIFVPVVVKVNGEDQLLTKELVSRFASEGGIRYFFPEFDEFQTKNPGIKNAIAKYFEYVNKNSKEFNDFLKEYKTKGQAEAFKNYIENRIKDNGLITLSYNGTAFDLKEGLEQGLFSKDFFVFKKHIDVLTDFVRGTLNTDPYSLAKKTSQEEVIQRIDPSQKIDGLHDADIDTDVTAKIALHYLNRAQTVNNIQTEMPSLIRDLFTKVFSGDINDLKADDFKDFNESQLKVNALTDGLDEGSIKYLNAFEKATNVENTSKWTKAIKDTLDDINYLYFKKDVEVHQRIVKDELDRIYESNKQWFNWLNKKSNHNKFLSVMSYLINKIDPNFLKSVNNIKEIIEGTRDVRSLNVFDVLKKNILQPAFKTTKETKVFDPISKQFTVDEDNTFSYLNFEKLQEVFMGKSEEDIINEVSTYVKTQFASGESKLKIDNLSYEDYKNNYNTLQEFIKSYNVGNVINEFLNSDTGKTFRTNVTDSNLFYNLGSKYKTLANNFFKYSFLNNDLRDRLLNDFSRIHSKNLNVDEIGNREFNDKVDKSVKYIDGFAMKELKEVLKEGGFSDLSYEGLYRMANPSIKNIKSIVIDDSGNEVQRSLKSTEIGLKENEIVKLTGLSYKELQNLYKSQDVYITVMRHPGHHVGSFQVYKLVQLSNKNTTNTALSTDTMLALHFGDFDGDHITIMKPQVETQEFAKSIGQNTKIGYQLLDYIFDNEEVLRIQSDTSSAQEAKLFDDLGIEIAKQTSDDLNQLDRKPQLYNALKTKMLSKVQTLLGDKYTPELANKILDVMWVKQYDVRTTDKKGLVFITHNRHISKSSVNDRNHRILEISKQIFFKEQAINDSQIGQLKKGGLSIKEVEKNKKLKDIIAVQGFKLASDSSLFIGSNLEKSKSLAIEFINNSKNLFLTQEQKTFVSNQLSAVQDVEEFRQVISALEKMHYSSDEFDNVMSASLSKLDSYTQSMLDNANNKWNRALFEFAQSRGFKASEYLSRLKGGEGYFALLEARNKAAQYLLTSQGENFFGAGSSRQVIDNIIEQKVHDITRQKTKEFHNNIKDVNGFKNWVGGKVLFVMDPALLSIPENTILLNSKREDGSDRSIKLGKTSFLQMDINDVLETTSVPKDVALKKPMKISNKITLPAGTVYHGIVGNPDGSRMVHVSYEYNITGQSKFAFAGSKMGKATVAGDAANYLDSIQDTKTKDTISTILKKNNIDFIYGEEDFNLKKISSLVAEQIKDSVVYLDNNGNVVKNPKDAVFILVEEVPIAYVGDDFWKDSTNITLLDETSFSNNLRSVEGMMLLGETIISRNNSGKFDYNTEDLALMNNFWNEYSMPYYLDNNAIRLHHELMLATLLDKIPPTILNNTDKRAIYENSLNNLSLSSSQFTKFFNGLVKKYITDKKVDIKNLNFTRFEKALLSPEVYNMFKNPKGFKIMGESEGIRSKSTGYKDIQNYKDLAIGDVEVLGESVNIGKMIAGRNSKTIHDMTSGYMSMKDYINLLINLNNIGKDEPYRMSFIRKKEFEKGTTRGFNNVAKAYNGYIGNKFNTVSNIDAKVYDGAEANTTLNNQKSDIDVRPVIIKQTQNKGFVNEMTGESYNYKQEVKDGKYGSYRTSGLIKNNYNYDDATGELKDSGDIKFKSKNSLDRFTFNLLNSMASTKSELGRAALYNEVEDRIRASVSPKQFVIGDEGRIFLDYDLETFDVSADDWSGTNFDRMKSYQFFNFKEPNENKLNDFNQKFSQQNVFDNISKQDDAFNQDIKNALDNESLFEKTTAEKIKEEYMKLNNFLTPASVLDEIEEEGRRLNLFGNNKNTRRLFQVDMLESSGVKIDDEDSLAVSDTVNNLRKSPVVYQQLFSKEFVNLFKYAQTVGLSEDLNIYAMRKGALSWIDFLTIQKNNTNDSKQKLHYDNLIEGHLKKINMTQAEAIAYVKTFEQQNSDVVYLFNNVNTKVLEYAKTYASLTDELSEQTFWILTPNHFDKGDGTGNKDKARMSQYSIFSASLPSSKGMATMYDNYNYYESMTNTIRQLSLSASYHGFATEMKQQGTMENNSVYSYIKEKLEQSFESLAGDVKSNGAWDIEEFKQKLFSSKEILGSGILNMTTIEETLKNHGLGAAYLEMYKQLKTFTNQSKMSYMDAYLQRNQAKNDTSTKRSMDRLLNAFELSDDILASIALKQNKNFFKDIYNSLKTEAQAKGVELVDHFGRKFHEDPKEMKTFGPASMEYIKRYLKYHSDYNGGFEANVVMDAIKGDVYFMNKSLSNHVEKYFFTHKIPNTFEKVWNNLRSLATQFIMLNPFKLFDRTGIFTAFDFSTLGLANPKTILYSSKAAKDLSAFMQSKGTVVSEELAEFAKVRGVSLLNTNFEQLFNDMEAVKETGQILKPYKDFVNKTLSLQHEFGRYAFWLAAKNDFDKGNTSASFYGAAYADKDYLNSLRDIKDANGNTMVSANGRKASFLMSRQIGGVNDFPLLAKEASKFLMFTTFPLAHVRWARGQLKSWSTALKHVFTSDSERGDALKYLGVQGMGLLGIYLVGALANGMIANAANIEEEEKKEWDEKSATPALFSSLILGKPVMNKFNSYNPISVLRGIITAPFEKIFTGESDVPEAILEFGLNTLASRAHPLIKIPAELMGGVDVIGGTVYDTSEEWSLWDNIQRKMLSFVIGGSGANALTRYIRDELPYADENSQNGFVEGLTRVASAELGNSRYDKNALKNYYKGNSIIQTYRFAEETATNYQSSDFNQDRYKGLKKDIADLMKNKAPVSKIYEFILDAIEKGTPLNEVRSAVNNNSLRYKVSRIADQSRFVNSLSESDLKTVQDAIAYETDMFPWLDTLLDEINGMYKSSRGFSKPTLRPNRRRGFDFNFRPMNKYYNRNGNFPKPFYNSQNPFTAYKRAWYNINVDPSKKKEQE